MKNKILLTFYFLFFTLTIIACAPKTAPPPVYEKTAPSLAEIIEATGLKDIETFKAITDIKVLADGKPHSDVSASAVLRKPGMSHIKAYKFGILVGDIIISDGQAHVLSGKVSDKVKEFSKELYNAVFWWDDMKDAEIYRRGDDFTLEKANKVITLDSATLLPQRQEIRIGERNIVIMYSSPIKFDEFWYPSMMDISLDNYEFKVRIEKLRLNPEIPEEEFSLP
ncbi:MAG: hypothetical protein HY807_04840 [Nitrospirae bacterium]|nr:hypothetical protein [Nitrospirota bacterium]